MASQFKYEGFPNFNIREKGKNRFKLIAVILGIVGVMIEPELAIFILAMLFLISGPSSFIYKLAFSQRNEQHDHQVKDGAH